MSKQGRGIPGSPEGLDNIAQLRLYLLQSSSWLINGTRQFLQPFDLTPKQYAILKILADNGKEHLSIQQIRQALVEKMSDASRLIERPSE